MTDTTEQEAVTPWFAWPARKTWEEVRVRLRSRDGNEWEEIASDFEYWMQSADGEMCDDVVAFQIIGETPLGLASVSSASADYVLVPREPTEAMLHAYQDCPYEGGEDKWAAMLAASPEPVPATNQAEEVEPEAVVRVAKALCSLTGSESCSLSWGDWVSDAKYVLAALAATPTPPTLSEDLREALGRVVRSDQVRDWRAKCDNPTSTSDWVWRDGRYVIIDWAALAQVKAS